MGQKVHPKAFRLKINKTWDSKWFSDSGDDFSKFLEQDVKIRKYITLKYSNLLVNLIPFFQHQINNFFYFFNRGYIKQE